MPYKLFIKSNFIKHMEGKYYNRSIFCLIPLELLGLRASSLMSEVGISIFISHPSSKFSYPKFFHPKRVLLVSTRKIVANNGFTRECQSTFKKFFWKLKTQRENSRANHVHSPQTRLWYSLNASEEWE